MASNARTSQDSGRRSASGASAGGDTSRGQQPSQPSTSGRGGGRASAQSPAQSAGQSPEQASAQPPGQRRDAERQVPLGRDTGANRQGAGISVRDQGQRPGVSGGGQRYAGASPFSFMARFGQEMDRLFEDFGFSPLGLDPMDLLVPGSRAGVPPRALGSGATAPRAQQSGVGGLTRPPQSAAAMTSSRATWLPQIEVLRRGDNLVVRADLPGLRPDDVRVEVDNGALTVSGERTYEAQDENEGLYHSERVYGSFVRTIPLPQGVNPEQIEARFNDGVLEVTVPVPQESRSRRIEVRGRQ